MIDLNEKILRTQEDSMFSNIKIADFFVCVLLEKHTFLLENMLCLRVER